MTDGMIGFIIGFACALVLGVTFVYWLGSFDGGR